MAAIEPAVEALNEEDCAPDIQLNETVQGLFKPDNYLCTLDSATQQVALVELREDEETRQNALQKMRDWIDTHPDIIRCRQDASFLLRFLRAKKFDVKTAQETLERYLLMRQQGSPRHFGKLDVMDLEIQDLLDRGIFYPLLEKDTFGRRVCFTTARCLDPARNTGDAAIRATIMSIESMLEDEETQVRGLTYILHEEGVALSVLTMFSLPEIYTLLTEHERNLPVRHKAFHLVSMPIVFNWLFEIIKSMIQEKLRNRIVVHYDMNSLTEYVPQEILPSEYGGKVPEATMIAAWKHELYQRRSQVMSLESLQIKSPPPVAPFWYSYLGWA